MFILIYLNRITFKFFKNLLHTLFIITWDIEINCCCWMYSGQYSIFLVLKRERALLQILSLQSWLLLLELRFSKIDEWVSKTNKEIAVQTYDFINTFNQKSITSHFTIVHFLLSFYCFSFYQFYLFTFFLLVLLLLLLLANHFVDFFTWFCFFYFFSSVFLYISFCSFFCFLHYYLFFLFNFIHFSSLFLLSSIPLSFVCFFIFFLLSFFFY